MNKKAVRINRLFLIAGILCLLFYLTEGITVRFGQSMLWLWPVFAALLIGRYFLWKRAWRRGKPHPFPRWLLITERCIVAAALAVFLTVEGFILSSAFRRPPEGLDAVIVLGARVEKDGPSGSLRERIEAAADYLQRNPDAIAVASGGQGKDEPMSEARCIRDHLVNMGVDPARILLEEGSTSTLENLQNSFALLEGKAETIGILTNDFHVYRALLLGRTLTDAPLSGIPARSLPFGFIHYAVREFCALTVSWLRGYFA